MATRECLSRPHNNPGEEDLENQRKYSNTIYEFLDNIKTNYL